MLGTLHLDADSATTVGSSDITFSNGLSAVANSTLILESSGGKIVVAGALTLSAGNGIQLWDVLMQASAPCQHCEC